MHSLLKIIRRKDYVEIIPATDSKTDQITINNFLRNIDNEKGKLIKLEQMEKTYSDFDDGTYTSTPGIYHISQNSYLIHYKCYKELKSSLTPKTF